MEKKLWHNEHRKNSVSDSYIIPPEIKEGNFICGFRHENLVSLLVNAYPIFEVNYKQTLSHSRNRLFLESLPAKWSHFNHLFPLAVGRYKKIQKQEKGDLLET